VRHIAVENKVVVTNQVPSGLNRGFGGPQFYYPLERMMDLAAKEIGIDPVELRLRNVVQTFPYETPAGSLLESGNYRRCIELALERAGYRELMAQRESARKEGRMFGIGMALAVETSASNMAYVNLALTQAQRAKQLPKSGAAGRARVIMDPLGAIIVHVDSLPNGQGHRTVVAQIVADEIGVNPEDVEVITDLDTFGGAWSITSGNYSNRFSTVVVSAVAVAARMAARKLRAAAAKTFGVEPGTVQLLSGMASAPGAGNEPVPIRRLAMQLHWDAGDLPEGVDGSISELAEFSPDTMTVPDEDDRMRSSLTYSFQCDLAGVEVNAETGRVQVHKYVSAHDAGTLLNPAVVEGQLRGGFAHGFGAAMLERVTYAADGTLLSGTFQDYLCPTAPELPDLGIAHYATPSPNTIQGAKGLGDGCSMIAPVAMANAIGDATGLRDLTPPFLPGRLWQLLHGGDPDLALTRPSSAPQDETGRQLSGTLRGRGTIAIEVARQKVWDALLDPVQLRAIIPGCQNIEQTSPDTFSAQIRVSIAGIGALYEAQIRIFDRKEPERLKLAARGESKLGFGRGEALVTLEEADLGVTQLTYEYGADVGGRVATFGQRMLDGVVKVVLADFFDRLRAHMRGEKPGGTILQRVRRLFSVLQALRGRS
jgi:2-furoyl-CoA dehydrogenase large subunit